MTPPWESALAEELEAAADAGTMEVVERARRHRPVTATVLPMPPAEVHGRLLGRAVDEISDLMDLFREGR